MNKIGKVFTYLAALYDVGSHLWTVMEPVIHHCHRKTILLDIDHYIADIVVHRIRAHSW